MRRITERRVAFAELRRISSDFAAHDNRENGSQVERPWLEARQWSPFIGEIARRMHAVNQVRGVTSKRPTLGTVGDTLDRGRSDSRKT